MSEVQGDHSFVPPVDASGLNVARGVLVSALSAPDAVWRLRRMDASGLLATLIPELEAMKGVQQPREHYWDVYEHSLQTVESVDYVFRNVLPDWLEADLRPYLSESADGECTRLVLLKLAALLHDIAKPQTKTFEPSGRMRFFGHDHIGAQVGRGVLARLGFSQQAQETIYLMIENHLRPGQLTGRDEVPTERALFRFFRDTGGVGLEILLLNLADHKAMSGPRLTDFDWQTHVDRTRVVARNYLAKQKVEKPAKLVDGHAVMSRFGLKPGPLVGELLSAVQEAQARGEIESKEEALALIERVLKGRDWTQNGV